MFLWVSNENCKRGFGQELGVGRLGLGLELRLRLGLGLDSEFGRRA